MTVASCCLSDSPQVAGEASGGGEHDGRDLQRSFSEEISVHFLLHLFITLIPARVLICISLIHLVCYCAVTYSLKFALSVWRSWVCG